jgi:thiol-disulfide isomerase/thioredoxin
LIGLAGKLQEGEFSKHRGKMSKVFTKVILSLIFLCGFVPLSISQPGYSILVTVKEAPEAKIRLAYHVGNQQYVRDSVYTDRSGSCRFAGAERLAPGVYMIVLPQNVFFEFLIGQDQYFDISCDLNDPVGTLAFKGSEENNRFLEYQRKWKALQDEAVKISNSISDVSKSGGDNAGLKAKLSAQEKRMKDFLHQTARENEGTLLGAIARSIIPVDPPTPEIPAGTVNRDSVARLISYNWYLNHFFDNIDFSQPGLIRSPVLGGKLDQFFRQVVIQIPDSLIKEADRVLKMSSANEDVYQYVAAWLMNRYASSEIMGQDAVVVYLADSVYLAGRAPWASDGFLADLKKRVDRIRPNLIGKKAPELLMNSFAGHYVSLYDVEAEFTIIYFWEPDCGHCKVATPLLRDFYNENKDKGIQVFAVCTQQDREKWEKYIVDNSLTWINGWDPQRLSRFDFYYNVESTPLIYILDRDKKIIAKRLAVEDIPSFLEAYRKYTGH